MIPDQDIWAATLAKVSALETRLRSIEQQQRDMDAQVDSILTHVDYLSEQAGIKTPLPVPLPKR